MLGTVIGRDADSILNMMSNSFCQWQALEDSLLILRHKRMPVQYSMLLLRYCMVPKFSYLIRTLPPSIIDSLCTRFDDLIIKTAFTILHLHSVDAPDVTHELMRKQISLPCKLSGFGLTSSKLIARFAYLDSLCRAVEHDANAKRFFSSPSPSLHSELSSILSSLPSSLHFPTDPNVFLNAVCSQGAGRLDSSSLQSTLSDDAHQSLFTELFDYWKANNDEFHMARMLACRAPGASFWKTATPIDSDSHLPCADYVCCAKMCLGVASFASMPSKCGYCLKKIGCTGIDSLHALSCVYLKGREVTQRHDDTQRKLEMYAGRAGVGYISHQNTFRFVERADPSRADLLASDSVPAVLPANRQPRSVLDILYDRRKVDTTYFWSAGTEDTDVTHPHPTCKTLVKGASKSILYAARFADYRKHHKHNTLALQLALNDDLELHEQTAKCSFKSFTVETYGGMHPDAFDICDSIATAAEHHSGAWSRQEVIKGCRSAVAIAVQKGNAAILRAGRRKAASGNAKYEHQILPIKNANQDVEMREDESRHDDDASSVISVSSAVLAAELLDLATSHRVHSPVESVVEVDAVHASSVLLPSSSLSVSSLLLSESAPSSSRSMRSEGGVLAGDVEPSAVYAGNDSGDVNGVVDADAHDVDMHA
jgi:hypothetical protein